MNELRFTDEIIANSYEIQNWLKQFNSSDINLIIEILKQLRIISIDELRKFIKTKLLDLSKQKTNIAIYPIRKFSQENSKFWVEESGNFKVSNRSPQGNGSEDLIISIINDLCKSKDSFLIESPDLNILKTEKIKHIVFVVDNSISGCQVKEFINSFFDNKTIKSYWSLGYFKLTILSLYLTNQAKDEIINNSFIANKRKYISFDYILGDNSWNDLESIENVLNNYKLIPSKYRLGYDNSASSVIFEHSVPNNIFGIFYCKVNKKNKKWVPLFPDRRIPINLLEALKNQVKSISELPDSHIKILNIIKLRNQTIRSIARKVGYSEEYTKIICNWLLKFKFIKLSKNFYYLDVSGKEFLQKNRKKLLLLDDFNFEIYTPAPWGDFSHNESNFLSSSYCIHGNEEGNIDSLEDIPF